MWTEVSSSVPHFLHMGSLHSPMICKCLLKVLCPVSRPITVLVCVLLRDSSRAHIARSGPIVSGYIAHSCGLFCLRQLTVSKGCHECYHAPLSTSFNYVRAAILKGICFKDKTFYVCGSTCKYTGPQIVSIQQPSACEIFQNIVLVQFE